MKIALLGYGKMGQLIHSLAEARGHTIVAVCNSTNPITSPPSQKEIAQADVCIDFSTPDSVLDNVKTVAKLKTNIVIGTTGWTEHLPEIQEIVRKSSIGLLHSPNFSLGVALFLKMIEKAANLVAPFEEYELAGLEIHHSQKIDRPSGTAKAIEHAIASQHPRPPTFTSIRVGNTPGTHSVVLDSPADTITLTHTARNREGFAHGAITAAEWLKGKKGVFGLDDLIKERSL